MNPLLKRIIKQRFIFAKYNPSIFHTHISRLYGTTIGEKNTNGSGVLHNGSPLLHKPLSIASSGDRAPLLISSFNVVIHVFLGLPLGLFPTTSNLVHLCTLSSSPFLFPYPNHLNLFLLHTSLNIPSKFIVSIISTLSLPSKREEFRSR
jgi:hypothetical protein